MQNPLDSTLTRKDYNKISSQLRKAYKLDFIRPNDSHIFANADSKKGQVNSIRIPNPSEVYDPYWDANGNEIEFTGDPVKDKQAMSKSYPKRVPIGVIDGVENGLLKFKSLTLQQENGLKIKIDLRENPTARVELEYLKLSAFNELGVFSRQLKADKLYKEENPILMAKEQLANSFEKTSITKMILNAEPSNIDGWYVQMGWPVLGATDVKKAYLLTWIEKPDNYAQFRLLAPEANISTEALIKRCVDLEIIRINHSNMCWEMFNGDYLAFSIPKGEDEYTAFVKYLNFDEQGQVFKTYLDELVSFYEKKSSIEGIEKVLSKPIVATDIKAEESHTTINEMQTAVNHNNPHHRRK